MIAYKSSCPDITVMKKFIAPLVFMSLLSLTACWGGNPAAPPASPSEETNLGSGVSTESPGTKESPTIDEQIKDVSQHNGDITQADREKLNNVPVIPDVFDK